VSRPKENLDYRVNGGGSKNRRAKSSEDDEIVLRGPKSQEAYPGVIRRVVVRIILDGVEQEMAFLTNNMTWSALTIAELYRCRGRLRNSSGKLNKRCKLGISWATTRTR